MRTNDILQLFTPYIQRELSKLSAELSKTWDFQQFENGIMTLMNQLEACLISLTLSEFLTNPDTLTWLKLLGSKLGMRFKEYRVVNVRLCNGLQIPVTTPYFLKAKAKRGPKKRGQMGEGNTLDWQLWGF